MERLPRERLQDDLARLAGGDRSAFTPVFETLWPLFRSFASRLVRALTPEDYAAVFADPEQPSLFARSLVGARPILTVLPDPLA